ncbi:UPF0182 family protein [Candidatus Micrarchaeota archaeon]|nr:UPF0182 family protein [Candidatus Micrarchaeota archaeon]
MVKWRRRGRTFLFVIIAVLIVLFLSFSTLINFFVDYQWFGEVGYTGIFLARIINQLKIGVPVFVVMSVLLFWYFRNMKKDFYRHSGLIESNQERKNYNRIIIILSLVLAFLVSTVVARGLWLDILRYINAVDFNVTDPIFFKDIGFYMFRLPLINQLLSLLTFIAVVLVIATVVFYGAMITLKTPEMNEMQDGQAGRFTKKSLFSKDMLNLAVRQIATIGFVILLILAARFFIGRYSLLFSSRGVAYGAGYTDITVTLKVYMLQVAVSVLSAVLIVYAAFTKKYKVALYGPILLVAVSILGNFAALAVQNLIVEPNEYAKERQYIENSIKYTQKAYGLDKIQEKEFAAADTLTLEDIQANQTIIENIRINDYRPTLQTYNQLQGIRPYYRFNDVDIDRYIIDGEYTQVFLSPRELFRAEEDQSWVNRYLRYTHGYGAVMSPVSSVTPQGQPLLLVRDIPPVSSAGIEINRPEIYFGELTNDYVITNAKSPEFDYPMGDDNVDSFYEGTGGIRINPLNKLVFALNQGSSRILLSGDVTSESRILLNRNIMARVNQIAPYFTYDDDPYLVINEGRMFWIIDGYTYDNNYPYSQPITGGTNYLRNSFKVVIDAYNGTTDYYLVDQEDAVVEVYSKIFPDLFKPIDQMPEGLRDHIRYPEAMFDIQAEIFRDYHMENPQVFYNKEDAWDIALEQYANETQQLESSYQTIKLPGEEQIEFVITVPYTPINKNNMIAFLVARNDGDNYGEMLIYKLPKNKLVYGPMQIESRISQDTEISRQISLWDQTGSGVIRGNLLAIPIEDSLLYVEPMFMEASGGNSLPELRRVIVAYGDTIVMEETLDEALEAIFGEAAPDAGRQEQPEEPVQPTEPGELPEEGPAESMEELIASANELFERAQEALRTGNWAEYGEHLARLEEVLNRLQQLTNR